MVIGKTTEGTTNSKKRLRDCSCYHRHSIFVELSIKLNLYIDKKGFHITLSAKVINEYLKMIAAVDIRLRTLTS